MLYITCSQIIKARNQVFLHLEGVYVATLADLLPHKLRYLGDESSLLSLEMLREIYMLVKGKETDKAAKCNKFEREGNRQNNKMTKEIPDIKLMTKGFRDILRNRYLGC